MSEVIESDGVLDSDICFLFVPAESFLELIGEGELESRWSVEGGSCFKSLGVGVELARSFRFFWPGMMTVPSHTSGWIPVVRIKRVQQFKVSAE